MIKRCTIPWKVLKKQNILGVSIIKSYYGFTKKNSTG